MTEEMFKYNSSIDYMGEVNDNEPVKRVELHAHSCFSRHDGVDSPSALVNTAYKIGHKAIALTDHEDIKGFKEADKTYRKILESDKDTDFKVIYGCEMNTVEERMKIVYNPNDSSLFDREYICFDFETTGLSAEHDYIIEFGGVLLSDSQIKERKQFFIKPPIQIGKNISNLTHITNEMLKDAKTFAECKDEILDFFKDRVLVAHNASFDISFLNAELRRLGLPKIQNTVIDTWRLSMSLFNNIRSYRLCYIASLYGVSYDDDYAHRADFDAATLAKIFDLMCRDLKKKDIKTLNDLANFQTNQSFVKLRAYHATVLCRNKEGIKALNELLVTSYTDTLATYGIEPEGIVSEPRIFKSEINKKRENLLIGSSCQNGEVFELAHTRSKEQLAKAISFFDFIEIQPLENYRNLYEDRGSFTKERLKVYIKDIIAEAKKQGKLVCATGDVHYVSTGEKSIRDEFINSLDENGLHHPLFVYDNEKRRHQITPDQHFRNTVEMLDAFAWLGDEKLIKEIVIDNPNKIAEMCEKVILDADETVYAKELL